MNFGQNVYNWFLSNVQYLILVGVLVMAAYLIMKREFTKLVGFGVIGVIAIGIAFNTMGFKDLLLTLFNTILGI